MSKSGKILLFNPRSAESKHRIPNSILQVAAAVHGKFEYIIVDGNLEKDPWLTIEKYLISEDIQCFASTVMPGPQLRQAIPFSKQIREKYPEVTIVWGGYFPSNHSKVVLQSGFVDYIINGPGDIAFPLLLEELNNGNTQELNAIKNLIYRKENGELVKTPRESLLDQNKLNALPYQQLNRFYPVQNYLGKTFLGRKTIAYHSSMGCPFSCSFCAVVPIYNGRWRGKSAQNISRDILMLKEKYGADAIEFHDNNFFTSRKRTVEFAKTMKGANMNWWGEGRIDTLHQYKDEDLELMRSSGLRMIFLGAETGNDEILSQMNKGGTQSGQMILDFSERLRKFDIIPELSFVLGMPADSPQKVTQQIENDINFIKKVKEVNPNAEIIIYIYSPVPTEGSELYETISKAGFSFPNTLEEWLDPEWEKFDLRKNPLTPWLTPEMVDRIRNFETVLNARYPTVSDFKLSGFKRKLLHKLSALRYSTGIYAYPYELKALQKVWRYRQPEIEGFYSE